MAWIHFCVSSIGKSRKKPFLVSIFYSSWQKTQKTTEPEFCRLKSWSRCQQKNLLWFAADNITIWSFVKHFLLFFINSKLWGFLSHNNFPSFLVQPVSLHKGVLISISMSPVCSRLSYLLQLIHTRDPFWGFSGYLLLLSCTRLSCWHAKHDDIWLTRLFRVSLLNLAQSRYSLDWTALQKTLSPYIFSYLLGCIKASTGQWLTLCCTGAQHYSFILPLTL